MARAALSSEKQKEKHLWWKQGKVSEIGARDGCTHVGKELEKTGWSFRQGNKSRVQNKGQEEE